MTPSDWLLERFDRLQHNRVHEDGRTWIQEAGVMATRKMLEFMPLDINHYNNDSYTWTEGTPHVHEIYTEGYL